MQPPTVKDLSRTWLFCTVAFSTIRAMSCSALVTNITLMRTGMLSVGSVLITSCIYPGGYGGGGRGQIGHVSQGPSAEQRASHEPRTTHLVLVGVDVGEGRSGCLAKSPAVLSSHHSLLTDWDVHRPKRSVGNARSRCFQSPVPPPPSSSSFDCGPRKMSRTQS